MVETTTAELVATLLKAGGYNIADTAQYARNLNSSKPNIDNLVSTNFESQEVTMERLFAGDGMPLEGIYLNSYDHAPKEYSRKFIDYPRSDSASRLTASEDEGAKINAGASKHLAALYPKTMALLGSLVLGKREVLRQAGEPEPERQLTATEALELLNASVGMWSLLSYRKERRMAKANLPPEVALLHRSMSGVRMSLLRLFIRDIDHEYVKQAGWQDAPFNTENWAQAVEGSGLLLASRHYTQPDDEVMVTADTERMPRQLCVASTRMIRQVIGTIVDFTGSEIPVADLQTLYGTTPETVLAYGSAFFKLEQARVKKSHDAAGALMAIIQTFENNPPRNKYDVGAIAAEFIPPMKSSAKQSSQEIADAFTSALTILGYNPQKFRQDPPSF